MNFIAQMAELVDAQVSGTCAARRGGSNPLLGTMCFLATYNLLFLLILRDANKISQYLLIKHIINQFLFKELLRFRLLKSK